jgi:DNA polymerase
VSSRDAIHQYFQQHQVLYGNELYLTPKSESNSEKIKIESARELDDFCNSIKECQSCSLGQTRTNFVFGIGDPNADLMLVGEAPDEKDELSGEPFVGRVGRILNKILIAIDKNRSDGVYIVNVLKCRTPNNRDPLPSEVEQCEPFLIKQINYIKPKLIVALGRFAGKTLLKLDVPLNEMRDKTHEYLDIPLRVTYHPAALLKNSNFKKHAWEDFQWIRDYLKNN